MNEKELVLSLIDEIVSLSNEVSDLRDEIKIRCNEMDAKKAEYDAHMELAQQKEKGGEFTYAEAKAYIKPYVEEYTASVDASKKAWLRYVNSPPMKKAGECQKRIGEIMKTADLGADVYRSFDSVWDKAYHHPERN